MKRHLAELRNDNAQTPPLVGKRSRLFPSGTPVAGLTDGQDDRQADTPDSVRPSSLVPGTTERLLAGFTLSTPIAGLKLQTPPWAKGGGPGRHPLEAADDQENGLPWLGHSQHQSSTDHPQLQQQQQQQQQGLQQAAGPCHGGVPELRSDLSFKPQAAMAAAANAVSRHRLAQGTRDPLWFGATGGSQQWQQQLQQLSQQASQQQQQPEQQLQRPSPPPPELPFGGSQQSLSLAHFFRASQHGSEGRTAASFGGSFGSQLADEVEQPPVSPPAGVEAASDRAGSAGSTFFAAAVAAAAGSAPTSGGDDAMCTPLTGWETRPLTQQAGSWQQEPEASPPQPLCDRQLVPPPQHQQHQQQHAQQPQRDGGIVARNWGATEHSPLGLSPALAEVLTGDSGSRAGVCTPLSEEDFVLKASQSYTRAMVVTSPLPPGAQYGGAGGHRDAAPTLAAGRDGCSGAGHVAAPACGGGEYRTPPHASSQDTPCTSSPQDAVTRLSVVLPGQSSDAGGLALTAEETATPELEVLGAASQEPLHSGRAAEQEATTAQALFPIFRPRNQRKCILLVRHGESTYNKLDAESRAWSDPPVFDAPLTQRGHSQALALRDPLARAIAKRGLETGASEPLWLVSPLTRAIETFLGSCPTVAERLRATAAGSSASSSGTAAGSGEGSFGGGCSGALAGRPAPGAPNVVVLGLIAEHCATSGDVGRPASDLARTFPALAPALSGLDEVWWYNPDPTGRPNCHRRKRLGRPEPRDHMRQRIAEFSRWLHTRPERLIVAFGHSQFWKAFSNSRTSLRNCEFACIWW